MRQYRADFAHLSVSKFIPVKPARSFFRSASSSSSSPPFLPPLELSNFQFAKLCVNFIHSTVTYFLVGLLSPPLARIGFFSFSSPCFLMASFNSSARCKYSKNLFFTVSFALGFFSSVIKVKEIISVISGPPPDPIRG